MSVPAGLANGLPVGMHLVASDFAESRLLNVAHQFQLNTDWHRLRATPSRRVTDMEWEAVIGLEVHVSLSTNTKLFSGTASIFGAEPNTEANIFDLAMPGTLPVLKKRHCGWPSNLAWQSMRNRKAVSIRPKKLFLSGFAQRLSGHPTQLPHSRQRLTDHHTGRRQRKADRRHPSAHRRECRQVPA